MTSVNSSEFNSYIQQAQGLLGQLQGATGSNTTEYINSCFDFTNSVGQMTSDDEQQKAAGIQNIINNIMSLVNKLVSNEAQSANQEVKRNSKAAAELQKKQAQAEAELNTEITNLQGNIEAQTGVVKTATETINETSKEIQKKQEEINEIIQQIQAKQQELSSAKTPEEKAQILTQIQGLSAQISSTTAEVVELQTIVADASSQVGAAVETIETAKGNAVEIQENGQMVITEIAEEGAQLIQANAQSNAKGVKNEVTGEAAQIAAEGASSNILTAGSAAKLYQTAFDQKSAGTTRTTGAINNLRSVMQGIGALNNNTQLLATFETAIGSALSEFTGYTGDWNTALEPVITGFGSFEALNESSELLQESVQTDLSSLGYTVNKDGKTEKENDSNNEILNSELLTPKVKINTFGI